MMRLRNLILLVAVVNLLVAGCGSAATPTPAGGSVSATLKEWGFDLSSSTASAGTIKFDIKNEGEKTHEFVVIKTDTAADGLPVTTDDEVDETAFTPVDEVEDVTAGSTATLTVDLAAGHYVILCNLTGHYAKGMAADFTVQ
jgi:uncharacterized cupredoxin-like copper-binding protein